MQDIILPAGSLHARVGQGPCFCSAGAICSQADRCPTRGRLAYVVISRKITHSVRSARAC
eukprot:10953288-Lingulodinium_polyedra.AAC.1